MRRDEILQAEASWRLARWEQAISAWAVRIAEGLRRKRYLILFLFSVFYFAATCYRASRKLFWFDELFTIYVCRLPNMASVWGALKQGVDFNPPLLYVLTRFAQSLFGGEGQVATRLPEIVCFWVFCLCLYRFVSTRTSALAGFIAMLFPLLTTPYYYAYEARAHGIVLGFAGIALVCWQGAIHWKRRAWLLTGLFLALLCAIITHTYAILLIVPFALAEFVRSLSTRRVDWPLWLTIAAPSLGALVSLPLFRASKTALPGTFFPATLRHIARAYINHLTPALVLFLAALAVYSLSTLSRPNRQRHPEEQPPLELPDYVVLIAFVAMPFFVYFLAKLTGAPDLDRYSNSFVLGFGCLFGLTIAKRPAVGLGVLFCLVALVAIDFSIYVDSGLVTEPSSHVVLRPMAALTQVYEAMESVPDKDSQIILFGNVEFLPIMYYAPPDIAPRLVYTSEASDVISEGYTRLQRCCKAPGRFESLSDLTSSHEKFYALIPFRSWFRLQLRIPGDGERDSGVNVKSVPG